MSARKKSFKTPIRLRRGMSVFPNIYDDDDMEVTLKTTGKNKRKREEEEEDRDATHATTTRRRRTNTVGDYVPIDSSKTLRFRERELITTLPVTTRQNSTSRIKLSRTTATQARRRIPIRPTRTTLNATSFSKSQKEVVLLLLDSESVSYTHLTLPTKRIV